MTAFRIGLQASIMEIAFTASQSCLDIEAQEKTARPVLRCGKSRVFARAVIEHPDIVP
jgi:hypothetical protein